MILIAGVITPILICLENYSWYFTLHHLLGKTCHQAVERCFYILDYPVGICCRCTGIYVGITLLLMNYFFFKNKIIKWKYTIIISFIGLAEKVIEILGIYNGTNLLRFISGFFLGVGLILIIINSLNFIEQSIKTRKGENE